MATTDRSRALADAVSTVSLARDLHRYGRHKAAEALFLQAIGHVERTLGPHDHGLAKILEAYMEFLVSLKREADAGPVRERLNEIQNRARPGSA